MIAIVIVEDPSELERARVELGAAVHVEGSRCLRRLMSAVRGENAREDQLEGARLPVFVVKGRDDVASGRTRTLGRRGRRGLATLERSAPLEAREEPLPETELSRDREIRFGRLLLQPAAHRAFVDGTEIELTWLEMRLLITFYERRDRVLSREELLRDVWDVRGDITTRTVDTHVKRLRSKLGTAQSYIETVRKAGYRFVSGPDARSALCSSSAQHGVGRDACRAPQPRTEHESR